MRICANRFIFQIRSSVTGLGEQGQCKTAISVVWYYCGMNLLSRAVAGSHEVQGCECDELTGAKADQEAPKPKSGCVRSRGMVLAWDELFMGRLGARTEVQGLCVPGSQD